MTLSLSLSIQKRRLHLGEMALMPAPLGPVCLRRTSRKCSTMQLFCASILSADSVCARSLINQMQLAPKHSIFKHFHFNLNVHKIIPLPQMTSMLGALRYLCARIHTNIDLQAQERYVSKMHGRSGIRETLINL